MMLSMFNLSLSPIMNICGDRLPGLAALKIYIYEKKKANRYLRISRRGTIDSDGFCTWWYDRTCARCGRWHLSGMENAGRSKSFFPLEAAISRRREEKKKDVCLRYRNDRKRTPPSVCRSEMA